MFGSSSMTSMVARGIRPLERSIDMGRAQECTTFDSVASRLYGHRMPRATPRTLAIPVAAIALGLAVALLLAGCPSKKPKTPACGSDEDCKSGLVCINKECKEKPAKAECTKDDDCADGKVCLGGKCQKCASDDQCGPGGKCQAGACDRAKKCSKDDDCADDEDCIDGVCQKPWQQGAGG